MNLWLKQYSFAALFVVTMMSFAHAQSTISDDDPRVEQLEAQVRSGSLVPLIAELNPDALGGVNSLAYAQALRQWAKREIAKEEASARAAAKAGSGDSKGSGGGGMENLAKGLQGIAGASSNFMDKPSPAAPPTPAGAVDSSPAPTQPAVVTPFTTITNRGGAAENLATELAKAQQGLNKDLEKIDTKVVVKESKTIMRTYQELYQNNPTEFFKKMPDAPKPPVRPQRFGDETDREYASKQDAWKKQMKDYEDKQLKAFMQNKAKDAGAEKSEVMRTATLESFERQARSIADTQAAIRTLESQRDSEVAKRTQQWDQDVNVRDAKLYSDGIFGQKDGYLTDKGLPYENIPGKREAIGQLRANIDYAVEKGMLKEGDKVGDLTVSKLSGGSSYGASEWTRDKSVADIEEMAALVKKTATEGIPGLAFAREKAKVEETAKEVTAVADAAKPKGKGGDEKQKDEPGLPAPVANAANPLSDEASKANFICEGSNCSGGELAKVKSQISKVNDQLKKIRMQMLLIQNIPSPMKQQYDEENAKLQQLRSEYTTLFNEMNSGLLEVTKQNQDARFLAYNTRQAFVMAEADLRKNPNSVLVGETYIETYTKVTVGSPGQNNGYIPLNQQRADQMTASTKEYVSGVMETVRNFNTSDVVNSMAGIRARMVAYVASNGTNTQKPQTTAGQIVISGSNANLQQ